MSVMKIAITGRMRSGKDSVGHILTRDYGFQRVAFGDALKRMAREYFTDQLEPVYVDCPFMKSGRRNAYYNVPRTLIQTLGQHMRELDEDIWIRQAEKAISIHENTRSTAGIVITDLRQPNEYEWARANGYTFIRVNANEDTRKKRARLDGVELTTEQLRHDTEMHVDDFEASYEVWNDGGDLAKLERRVAEIMSEIKDEITGGEGAVE